MHYYTVDLLVPKVLSLKGVNLPLLFYLSCNGLSKSMNVSLVMVIVLSKFCSVYKSMDTESNSETRGAFEFQHGVVQATFSFKAQAYLSCFACFLKWGINQVYYGIDEMQNQVQAVLASILFYHFGIIS